MELSQGWGQLQGHPTLSLVPHTDHVHPQHTHSPLCNKYTSSSSFVPVLSHMDWHVCGHSPGPLLLAHPLWQGFLQNPVALPKGSRLYTPKPQSPRTLPMCLEPRPI